MGIINPKSLFQKFIRKPATLPKEEVLKIPSISDEDLKALKEIGATTSGVAQAVQSSLQINFERQAIYKEVDRALTHWMCGGATELFADYITTYNPLHNATVWITADSKKYQTELTDMLERIGIEEKIFDWAYTTGGYGDLMVKVNALPGTGITHIEDNEHPINISRVDHNGVLLGFYRTPLGFGTPEGPSNLLPPWEYVHFRVLGSKKKRPSYDNASYSEYRTMNIMGVDTRRVTSEYGTSILLNGIPVYKRLRMAEDSLLFARLTRGILRYIYKIRVTGSNISAVKAIIDQYTDMLKHARAIDTSPEAPYFDSKCLVGNTEIRFCDGTSVAIKDIVEDKDTYIERSVWSVNPETLQIEPVKVTSAKKTRRNAKLIRVHLDNSKYVDCTPDHRLMLRNGTYKEARDLEEGTSLMPFYSKLSKYGMAGYELVYNPSKKGYCYAHRVTFNPKCKKGKVIHHKDFNPLNNDPSNLELLSTSEHRKLHVEHGGQNKIIKCFRTKSCSCGCGEQFRVDSRYPRRCVHGHNNKGRVFGKRTLKRRTLWLTKECENDSCSNVFEYPARKSRKYCSRKCCAADAKRAARERGVKQKVILERRNCACGCGNTFLVNVRSTQKYVNKEHYWKDTVGKERVQREVRKCLCGCGELFEVVPRSTKKFISREHMYGLSTEFRKQPYLVANHKVVRIEYLSEREDTYDIEVEKNHNFSLACGVFVHNSNPMSTLEDVVIPVWGDSTNDLTIDEIGGKVDIKWIVDVEELRNQLASALRVPLPLLGGFTEEAVGALGSTAYEKIDVRFARTARRLQRALIQGITRLCQIHLAYQNMNPDAKLFQVHMPETSTAEEMSIIESLERGVTIVDQTVDMLSRHLGDRLDRVSLVDYLNNKFLKLSDFELSDFIRPEGVEESREDMVKSIKEGVVKLLQHKGRQVRLESMDLRAALPHEDKKWHKDWMANCSKAKVIVETMNRRK